MSDILVAYFSASGVTAKVAKKLADVTGADLFEIVPAAPYTRADLDWTDRNSRSSREMRDKSFRPAIAETTDTSKYGVIFVGFPIWWYVAPTIVNTFLESCDLQGKTIVPFATSGGSGMGNTAEELKVSCKGAIVKSGRRFPANVSEEEIAEWAKKQIEFYYKKSYRLT